MVYKKLLAASIIGFFASITIAAVKPKKPYQPFSMGVFLNIDLGLAKYRQPDFFVRNSVAPSIRPGVGLTASKGVHKNVFLTVMAGYTTSAFNFKFEDVNGEPRLEQLNMGFYQGKALVNYVINPNSYSTFFIVNAGVQALQRIYTQEQYINQPVDNVVWPKTSIFPEIGIGMRNYFEGGGYIQPNISLRIQPTKTLIYDRTINQISMGFVMGGDIRSLFKREAVNNKPVKIKEL